ESNIADALLHDTTLRLQDGGTLKVSKGPEKAVQYWRKESGQYVEGVMESPAEQVQNKATASTSNVNHAGLHHPLAQTPLLVLPPASSAYHSGSNPNASSSNIVASTERMQEILDRMFSDQDGDEGDSDTISEGDESVSTFSDRVSAAIMAIQQKQQDELMDAQSMYRSDILEPVLEHLDPDAEHDEAGDEAEESEGRDSSTSRKAGEDDRPTIKRSGTGPGSDRIIRPNALKRAYSGPVRSSTSSPSFYPRSSPTISRSGSPSPSMHLRPSKSGTLGGGRPLAQTPLYPPPVLPPFLGTLSRQSSHQSLRSLGGTSGGAGTNGLVRQGSVELRAGLVRKPSKGLIVQLPDKNVMDGSDPLTLQSMEKDESLRQEARKTEEGAVGAIEERK
ncbi:hypothetical protein BGW38_003579, partial [Lunasporangiospora selenospora]